MEELLTVEDVCNILRLARQTVYQLISNQKIPFVKISGRAVRCRESEIRKWLEEKSRTALPHDNPSCMLLGGNKKQNHVKVFVRRMTEKAKKEVMAELGDVL